MSAPRASARPTPGSAPHVVIDGVTVLHWPADADARHEAAETGRPRILVVDDGEAPPLTWGPGEDWVRADAGRAEVAARTARLAAAPPPEPPVVVVPTLDADGIVRGVGGRWAAIPPIEARLLAPLLARAGHVVHRADLETAGWSGAAVGDRALDGRIKLLRRRVASLGVRIHTVRGLGYLLEALPPP